MITRRTNVVEQRSIDLEKKTEKAMMTSAAVPSAQFVYALFDSLYNSIKTQIITGQQRGTSEHKAKLATRSTPNASSTH